MTFKRVLLVYLLRQAMMGWIPYSSTYCQMHMGSYSYVPSCQTPKATTFRGLECTMLIRCGQLPGMLDGGGGLGPGSMREVGGVDRW
jgi:hypothetical protein